jgi:hypothetical protein
MQAAFTIFYNQGTQKYELEQILQPGSRHLALLSEGSELQLRHKGFLFGAASAAEELVLPLPSTYTTASRSFSATMYLMWQSGSTTFTSIPVPIGSVAWQFSGSATEPQQNSTWGSPTGSGSAGGFTAATGAANYPTWNGLTVPPNQNCH